MEQFSEWFIEFFKIFFGNIWTLIKTFFIGIYNLFIGFPINYYNDFIQKSKTFNITDWILSIVFIFVFLILILMILAVIFQLIKRYFRFTKIEFEKMTLLNQMNILEKRIRTNNIINIKGQTINENQNKKQDLKIKGNRFTKLNNLDEKYKFSKLPTYMTDSDKLTLPQIVNHFRNYAAFSHNLYYDEKTAATFLAGMATSKIMILEGISGTGKTSLPYVFGKFINNDASIISVQPSWRDRFEMMGYFNEFTKKFNETEFLASIYEATYRTDINLIVLDEMNLARVEYYFADFLSLLELPNSDEWLLEVVPEQLVGDPINLVGGKLKIPENVWFVGTANNDDSTFAITDKVYDRASSISMNEKAVKFLGNDLPKLNISYDYIKDLFNNALDNNELSKSSYQALEKLDTHIAKTFQITFGNRIMKQLETFVPVFVACGRDEVDGIDYIISRKIIRKFETLNLPFLKKEMEELVLMFDNLFGKNKLYESKSMIQKFINQV